MSRPLRRLAALADKGLVNVVIDTPCGSAAKFKYDEEHDCYRLSRLLPAGMAFPYNFGSIPGTLAADGDPLDLLVLSQVPLFVGCLLQAKLIGVLQAEQSQSGKTMRNDRLFGVVVTDVNPPLYDDLDMVGTVRLAEIEHFFISYNRVHGREFRPLRIGDKYAAAKVIEDAQTRYCEQKK